MNPTSRLAELDLLRRQVADLERELTERNHALREQNRQLDDELVDLREQSEMLRAIVTGTAAETGDDYFPTLVFHLSSVLGVQYAVVGEVQHGPIKKIRTIAVSAGGVPVDNFEYALTNTPCETALRQSFACFERDITTLFPTFERLAQLGVEGYCGVPLRAKGGAVIGLLVVMDTKPLQNTERLKSLMSVFASRAGAELQRRQAETELNQQRRHLVEAQALAHLGSWDWDINSGNVQWSAELFRILGYEPGAVRVTYDAFLDSVYPDDHDYVRDAINETLTEQANYDVECRIVRPDGEIRTIHCRGEVFRDENGRSISMSSSVLDITDRKRAEEALRASQEKLHQALQASCIGLWDWNTETNDVTLSAEWKRQLGYEETELADSFETWEGRLHPDDRDRAIAYVMNYVRDRQREYRQEFRLRHKDGAYRWIEARASFVTEADGRRIRLLGLHTDITERKRMEESLRESEDRYRTLLELSPSGVFVFCEREEIYQDWSLWLDSIHPEDRPRVKASHDRFFHGEPTAVFHCEYRIVRRDGEIRWISDRRVRLTGWENRVAGIADDITHHKQQLALMAQTEAIGKIGGWELDVATNRLWWSDETYRLHETTSELYSPTVETALNFYAPENRLTITDAFGSGVAQGIPWDLELELITARGRRITVRTTGQVDVLDGRVVRVYGAYQDVTERKRAEEVLQRAHDELERKVMERTVELRESEERYRTLVELSPCGVYVFCEGRTVYVNHTGVILMGAKDAQEILDRPTLDFVHPDYHPVVRENMKRLLSGGMSVHSAERVYLRMDGTPVPVQIEAARITWNGKPAILGTFSDITERKSAEQQLRATNQVLQALVDTSPLAIVGLDGSGEQVTLWNPAAERTFGWHADEVLGRPIPYVPAGAEASSDGIWEQVARDGVISGTEVSRLTKSGAVIDVALWVTALKGGDGLAARSFAFIADITERKRAEEALANLNMSLEQQVSERTEALRLYQEIFTHSIDGLAVIDLQGRYLQQNSAHEQLLGYPTNELEGKTPAIHLGEETFARIGQELADTGRYRGEVESRASNGAVLKIDLTAFVVKNAEGQPVCYVGIKRDVTERNRAQKALRESEERLRLAMEAADLGSWDVNVQTGEVVWNRRHALMQGYEPSPDPVSIQRWKDRIHPDDFDRVMVAVEQAKEAHEMFSVEHRTLWGDGGEERCLSLYGRFFYDDTGVPFRFSGVSLDVTGRNRAQEALRESEARFQQFANSVNSVFWMADLTPDGYAIVYVNSAFARIWGISVEELYRTPSRWLDSIHPEDRTRVEAAHVQFISEGPRAEFHCEYRIVDGDGRVRWISDCRVRMTGWDHRIAGIAEDITNHRHRFALMAQTEAIGKIGGWEVDFLADRLWWSDETYRLHDTTPELYSPTVETALNFYTPDSRSLVADALGQAAPWDLELELITARGRRIAVRAAGKVDIVNGRAVRAYGTFQDITERKRAEKALRAAHDELERKVIERTTELQTSQERYARATAVGKVGVWELDVANGHYHGDANLKALFGYTPEELSTDPYVWLNLVHPDDQPIAMKNWEQMQGGAADASHYELRMLKKDGSIVWTDVRCHGVRDQSGRLTHLIGATVDITERKEAEVALRESEERFAKAFRGGPNPIGITELETGRCLEVNDACLQSFGFSREEVIGNTTLLLGIWPNHEDRARLVERLKAGEPVRNLEFVLQTKSREMRHFLASCDLVELGGTQCLITIANDITDRKRAEDALRESEERFAKAFRTSPHPIGITELATGRCVEVNDACLQLFGFHREEVIGQTTLLLGIWPNHEDRARLLERLKAGQPVRNLELSFQTKSGDVRHLLVSTDLAELNGTLCLITVGSDVTERKRATEALQRSERDLRTVLDALPIGVWFTNRKGETIVSNPASQRIWTSVREVEWVSDGRTWTELTEHSTGPHRWALTQVLTQGEPSFNETFQLDCDGEGRKTILNTAVPVRDEDGTVVGAVVLNEDVTDRVKAEVALRASEERFAKAFQASLHPIVISELDTSRIVEANDAAYQLFGYRKQEVMGRTTVQIGLWHSMEERARYLELLKRHGSVRNVEVKLHSREGEVRECLLSSELIELNGKQCIVTVGDDITERKRAEEALRASEERFRSIFQNAGTGIAIANMEGRFIQSNPAYCMIVGYTEEELSRFTFQRLIHPDDYAHNLDLVEQLVNNFIPSFEVENRYVHKEGHVVQVHKFITALRGDDGKLTHFIALVTDVSERKRAELELRRSHTFLRQVIDTAPNLIFAKDREGRFAMANKAVADCYGATVEELIGKSDADFNADLDEVKIFRQIDLEVMNLGQDRFIPEERITDAEGKTRWLQTVKRPIFDDHGHVRLVLGAATEITERKRMEEVLRQRERDLNAALQERERISQDLHDGILQSLYAVGLGLEGCKPMVRQQAEPVAEKFITTLDHAIGQLNQVMGELRNFIAGLESHVIQGGDFPAALRTMVRAMSGSASAKCVVRIDDGAARRLSTEQALHVMNIVREGLSNALRHSRAKRITVSLRQLLRSVRLTITDDGVGFHTRTAQGVGYGLANMAARAQKVHGSLVLRSKPFKGTRIVLDVQKEANYAHN